MNVCPYSPKTGQGAGRSQRPKVALVPSGCRLRTKNTSAQLRTEPDGRFLLFSSALPVKVRALAIINLYFSAVYVIFFFQYSCLCRLSLRAFRVHHMFSKVAWIVVCSSAKLSPLFMISTSYSIIFWNQSLLGLGYKQHI